MLWHNKSAVSMTFVCFGIAKLECQMLTIIGYFLFSLLYAHAWYAQKEKYAKTIQSKKIKMLLNMIVSVYSKRYGSYRMYLEGNSPHYTVMIVCELKWFSHVYIYTILRCSSHTTHNILCYSWYMCRYNVIWLSQGFTCVNVCTLNCLNLF